MNYKKLLDYYKIKIYDDKIPCPFHEEKKPSLCFDLNKGIFHCFGCGAKGNIYDFVSMIEKVSKLEAVKIVSKIMNGNIPKSIEIEDNTTQWLKDAKKEFRSFLVPDWNMKNYLTDRGFTPSFLKKYGVRVNVLSDYRWIIPLYERNKFVGFVRRLENGDGYKKYMYNRGFRRNKTLIGNYGGDDIFVTEGILDYMKALQYGARNIVCLLGWRISKAQIIKLKQETNNLIVALDNDERGKDGIKEIRQYFHVKTFRYPKGIKDICEMTRKQFKFAYKEATNG